MSTAMTAWFETIFNVVYLIAIWAFVYLMTHSMKSVADQDRPTANLIRVAFILLAAGDTGHVGFRVAANFLGGTTTQVNIMGIPMSLIGLGMLTTAYTVTLFYMVFVYVWKARFDQRSNWLTSLLLAFGVFRLIFMALPGNEWGNPVPPQPMSIYRNLPLVIQGIGIIGLFLYSANKKHDVTFKWIGWLVVISFAFYAPVILFAQQFPLVGLLMIPKTCAYLAIAWVAYRNLWHQKNFVFDDMTPVSTDAIV